MRQSRLMSLVEATANVVIGYGLAVLTQILVFPMFGVRTTLGQSMALGVIFTVVSIARTYMLRRLFEGLRVDDLESETAAREGGSQNPRNWFSARPGKPVRGPRSSRTQS
jgi:hypothetical protein